MKTRGILFFAMIFGLVACGPAPESDEISPATQAEPEAMSFLGQPLYPSDASVAMIPKQEQAENDWENARKDLDAIIWYGRRTAYLGRYQEAISIYSEGLEAFPDEPRLFRHRGHRFISTRQLDLAIEDFKHAAALIEGADDRIEPDGLPNAQNIPVSTLHTNIWYHFGLAYYLKNKPELAAEAWQQGLDASTNDDNVVSTTHWLYMTLRRLERDEEAVQLLDAIKPEMNIIENFSYHQLCLFYKGVISEDELLGNESTETVDAAVAYGLGNWYLANGDSERAEGIFAELVDRGQWAAFGHIAAEADLARGLAGESGV